MKQANMPVIMGLKATGLCGFYPLVLEVYVASQTKDGDVVQAYPAWCDRIAEVLCDLAGGCTRYQARGQWLDPETHVLQSEYTTVLRAYVAREALLEGLPKLRQVLVQYGRECEQHTVAFGLDGELFGLDPTVAY